MSAEAVNAAAMAFKKMALIERTLQATGATARVGTPC